MADRAHDSSAAFHSHIGVRRCHTLPGSHDDILLHGISFNSCCQMGRYSILIQVRKEHILRLTDLRETIYKSCIAFRYRRRSADGRLIVAYIISSLSQSFYQECRHIGLANIRICSCNKKSSAHPIPSFLLINKSGNGFLHSRSLYFFTMHVPHGIIFSPALPPERRGRYHPALPEGNNKAPQARYR